MRSNGKNSVMAGRAGSPLHAGPGSSARGGVQWTARPTSSRHHSGITENACSFE
jgi:hypothetical protein